MNIQEQNRSNAISEIFKSLGHPTRLFIVEKLAESEHCVCELRDLVGADMSTISRHLSILKQAGVVKDRKDGTTVYYSLSCNCLSQMLGGAENVLRMKMEQQTGILEK